ncbi:MAG: arginine decarboxylase, partial [Nitrospinales bacterium]
MDDATMSKPAANRWNIENSLELYNIEGWGAGYFGINEKGHLVVRPQTNNEHIIDLKELVDDIQARNYSLPALIRFSDVLKSSIANLTHAFKKAAQEYGYTGEYHGIYPIKVNQQRQVVEEIVKFGRPYNIGLEAGSKPELHAILAIMDNPEALLICNGHKDEPFIRLALMGQKLGKKVFIVVEKLSELKTIIRVGKELNIRPNIGMRIKLVSAGSGRWSPSAGEQSKFGLGPIDLTEALQIAKEENIMDCLRL